MEIVRVNPPADPDTLGGLSELLNDAIRANASIGFTQTLAAAEAGAWWTAWLDSSRLVWVARDGGRLVGTVTLAPSAYPNGRHRADVAKLLVHSGARRQGIASRLMAVLETAARDAARTTLVLDTETGSDAERLYQRLGWTAAGSVPRFCYGPDGRLTPTTFYYKHLG